MEARQGPHVLLDGQPCLTFCSNDYLGLAGHSALVRALQQAAERYGVGSTGAHLISGHTAEHEALEEELADFVGRPRALLFSTGYMANMGVINALTGPDDRILEDALNHASLLDGGWLSRAEIRRYPHADLAALAQHLEQPPMGRQLVVTDAVFSMDGRLAPLVELADLAAAHAATLMVDDAHGLGVLGRAGAGSMDELGLGLAQVPVYMGTLGKALGTFGAFVAGSEDLIEFLIQRARTYIYTTAPPAAVAAATRAALHLARTESWRREHLQALISRLRQGAAELGLPLLPSRTPIQPLLVGEAPLALRLSQALLAEGLLITAIRPPTVPPGTARLRITLSAAHREADIDRLLVALERHYHRLRDHDEILAAGHDDP
jgi:8-amino-7-oxononanoate synthase